MSNNQCYNLVMDKFVSEQDQAKINALVAERMRLHEPIQAVSFIDGKMTWNFYGKPYTAKNESDIKNFLDEFLDEDETYIVNGNSFIGISIDHRRLTIEGKVKHILMENFKKTFLNERFPNWEKVEWSDNTTTIVKSGYNWNHFACWIRDTCRRI